MVSIGILTEPIQLHHHRIVTEMGLQGVLHHHNLQLVLLQIPGQETLILTGMMRQIGQAVFQSVLKMYLFPLPG